MKTNRKSRRYVVGFDNDQQCVYGCPGSGNSEQYVSYFRPMTMFSARRELGKMRGKTRACIYELVPVEYRKAAR